MIYMTLLLSMILSDLKSYFNYLKLFGTNISKNTARRLRSKLKRKEVMHKPLFLFVFVLKDCSRSFTVM